jgi:serine/threonine-protein kinase
VNGAVPGRATRAIVVDPPKDGAELLGKTLGGRYIVESILGKGGMGTVLRVRHASLGRRFALKVLRREIVVDPASVERFLQEAKIMASVRHPNLVEVTDFGELTHQDLPSLGNLKQPFFVMELLEGETLADLLRRGGPLDARTAARLFERVADALAVAHDKGVVHRDLKPDNIFLMPSPSGPVPKVLDFGVAKLVGASKLTRAGIVFGTPYYMAPEQATGQPVDGTTDQYSLGVVMYEALSGAVPFDGDTHMGVMTKHAFVAPEPLLAVVREPERLGAIAPIVMRCLEKRPEARYASARQLGEALFAIGGAIEHSTPTPVAAHTAPNAATRAAPTVVAKGAAASAGLRPWMVAVAACLSVVATGLGVIVLTKPGAGRAAPPGQSSEGHTPAAPSAQAPAATARAEPAPATANPVDVTAGSAGPATSAPAEGGSASAAPRPSSTLPPGPRPAGAPGAGATATGRPKHSVDEVDRDLW